MKNAGVPDWMRTSTALEYSISQDCRRGAVDFLRFSLPLRPGI